jgi:hypothetical protein
MAMTSDQVERSDASTKEYEAGTRVALAGSQGSNDSVVWILSERLFEGEQKFFKYAECAADSKGKFSSNPTMVCRVFFGAK